MLRVLNASATVCNAAGLALRSSFVGSAHLVTIRELARTDGKVWRRFVQDDDRNEGEEESGIDDTNAIVMKAEQ